MLDLAGDVGQPGVQVQVGPAQPAGLTAAQPLQRDQMVGGEQAVPGSSFQEPPGLGGSPDRDRRAGPGAAMGYRGRGTAIR